jgi:hypothetical protein
MFIHCGQVRHKILSATDLIQKLHVHPTATTIRDDIDEAIQAGLAAFAASFQGFAKVGVTVSD